MTTEDIIHQAEVLKQVFGQEKALTEQLSKVRAKRNELKAAISQYLKEQELDEATFPDIATFKLVSHKRFGSLKRKTVEGWAQSIVGEQKKSLQEVKKLYDTRECKFVEDLLIDQHEV